MTKKVRIALAYAIAYLILCVFAAAMLFKKPSVAYAEMAIEGWTQENGAVVGDMLEVPTNVKLKAEDDTWVDAESGIIYFPDGNARDIAPMFLDTLGKYTLEYTATYKGQTLKSQQSFLVNDINYSVSEEVYSNVTYKTAAEIRNGNLMGSGGSARADGIELSLAQGQSFRYSNPINIYQLAAKNEGKADIITAYPEMDSSHLEADKYGKGLVNYFIVKLIDCYDANNYVEIYVWNNRNNYYDGNQNLVKIKDTYAGAGAKNQRLCGLQGGTTFSNQVAIDGTSYYLRYSDRYAAAPWGAWLCGGTNNEYSKGGIKLSMDVNKNQIFSGNTLIADLDHPLVYPDNPFKGFTTGEVYMEVSFEKYQSGTSVANAQITSIFGMTGEELKRGLTADTDYPTVAIDVEYTDVAKKSINVAYGEEFTLPAANVYDVNGKNEYKLAVYYDYYTDNPKSVYLKDGKFTPDKKGVMYTAVYMAVDQYGNRNVDGDGKCVDVVNMIPVTGEKFTYTEDKVDQLNGGAVNALPYISASSKNLLKETKVYVIAPDGNKKEITDSLSGDAYTFIPEYIGEYTVEYAFSDNLYAKSFTYKVQSVDVSSVLFQEEIALPSIFIKDAIYDLEPYYVDIATAHGFEAKLADFFVSVDGGEFTKIENTQSFKVTGSESLRFKVAYNGKELLSPLTCQIVDVNYTENSSVNNGRKAYEKYFVGYDTFSADISHIEYGFDGVGEEKLTYAAPLVFNAFKFEFEIAEEETEKFNQIDVILKEIGGGNKGYVISYTTASSTTVGYSIKGLDGTVYYNGSVSGTFSGLHTISIQDSTILCGEGKSVVVPALEARSVEFSLEFGGYAGEFKVRARNICGTTLCDDVYEMPAQLVYTRPLGAPRIGQEYQTPFFNISSPFAPVSLSNLTYSFKDAKGNALKDKEGKALENLVGGYDTYTIVPQEVKLYLFSFTYDNYGGYLAIQDLGGYVINVMDTIPPTVTFGGGVNEQTTVEVKVGEAHAIKAFTATDNVTAAESLLVKVMIDDGNGRILAWNIDKSAGYTFTKAGNYRVVVYCEDASKNLAITYYNVVVK